MKKFFGFLAILLFTNNLLSQQVIDGSELDSITALNITDLSNFVEALKAKNYDELMKSQFDLFKFIFTKNFVFDPS